MMTPEEQLKATQQWCQELTAVMTRGIEKGKTGWLVDELKTLGHPFHRALHNMQRNPTRENAARAAAYLFMIADVLAARNAAITIEIAQTPDAEDPPSSPPVDT